MAINNVKIINDAGLVCDAQTPTIISASRATDIPAFYSDWFLSRLKKKYSAWINPFNGVRSYISYQNTRLIVFWSKNPQHLLDENGCIDYLQSKGINTYIQFTLNEYVDEQLEKGVPSLNQRIETFKKLVDRIGYGKVIWRFDPLILTDKITIDSLIDKISNIGNEIHNYTEKLVFSFADIKSYRKVQANLSRNKINYREFTQEDMLQMAKKLSELNKNWGLQLATCSEKIDLSQYGIIHNKCIDDDLMIKYFSDDSILMNHLGVEIGTPDLFSNVPKIIKHKNNKDKGQRLFCGCIASKDIGEYNTCPHLCEYCYANTSKEIAIANWKKHSMNTNSETITGI